jgi:TatD DNase family protein
MLIDTHCHLDATEFDADRPSVLQQARAGGVRWIVMPSVGAENFDVVAGMAAANPGCAYSLGIHPMYVDRARDADLALLRRLLSERIEDPLLVAVGEIGLDFFVDGLDRERQERFFAEQLALAREFGLPVLLHVRRSQDTVLKHLRRVRPPAGIAHAFNGSEQQARGFLDLDFALGFGGAMTFERARQIRRLVADLPAHAHVLETDAPDIPPAWLARGRNSPAELARIAECFAALRGLTLEEACAQTARNALRVMPRLGALVAGLPGGLAEARL